MEKQLIPVCVRYFVRTTPLLMDFTTINVDLVHFSVLLVFQLFFLVFCFLVVATET